MHTPPRRLEHGTEIDEYILLTEAGPSHFALCRRVELAAGQP